METSGRDVAMFHYVNHMFRPRPLTTNDNKVHNSKPYHKLALHFTVTDLTQAQTSVDQRMTDEIFKGMQAVEKESVTDSIRANAGGPYGSEVLPGVQRDSDRVWNEKVLNTTSSNDADSNNSNNKGEFDDWFKATIQINAHATKPWTAQAVKPDGTLGTEFTFEKRIN